MQHRNKFFLGVMLLFTQMAFGQKTNRPIVWYYNYFYGSDTLIFGKVYQDANGNPLKFDRFQFYTSGIKVLEKSGDTLDIKGSYVLSSGTDGGHDLGTHLVGEPESVMFQLGVDSQANHSDPSTYPENHALYHKIPTMHWGWETGYRFWVIEGWIDDDRDGKFTNRFEFHIVGDPLLKTKVLSTAGIIKDEKLFLVVDVDLKELLNGIDLTQNNVFHGGPWDHGSGPIIKIANNSIARPSFKAGTSFNLSALEISNPTDIRFYPNPTHGALNFESTTLKVERLSLWDLQGRLVEEMNTEGSNSVILSADPGVYMVVAHLANGEQRVHRMIIR